MDHCLSALCIFTQRNYYFCFVVVALLCVFVNTEKLCLQSWYTVLCFIVSASSGNGIRMLVHATVVDPFEAFLKLYNEFSLLCVV